MNAKKLLIALLALIMACSMILVSCDDVVSDDDNDATGKTSSGSASSESSEAVIDLNGSWETELDIGGLLTDAIAAGLGSEIETIEFKASLTFEFDNGEAQMKMVAKEDSSKVVDIMLELAYQIVLEQGVEMTYDEYLELVEQENLMPDLEAQADQVIASLETESDIGDYSLDGKIITFSDGTFEIEYTESSFTIKKINIEDAESLGDMEKEIFELLEGKTYNKVK